MEFKEIIQKLIEKKDLTREETEQAMLQIMEGKLSDLEIANFLVALKSKGVLIAILLSTWGIFTKRLMPMLSRLTENR